MKGKKRKLHVKKERMVPITSDKGTSVQRTHKDTLFRFIFRDKRKLYNYIMQSMGQSIWTRASF